MRADADRVRILDFLAALGREAQGPGAVFLTGGATAVLHGWRPSTVDVDLSFGPEPAGVFAAIARLKNSLDLNVELVSPAHFVPELPGWRGRCVFIGRFGRLDAFHYDPYGQALSKIERSHPRDRADVAAMLRDGLVEPNRLRELFQSVRAGLDRYPAVDADGLAARIEDVLTEPIT